MIPLALMPQPIQIELVELAEFDTSGFARAVVVENNIAYLLDVHDSAPSKLVLIDISDPSNPTELGSFQGDYFPIKLDSSDWRHLLCR